MHNEHYSLSGLREEDIMLRIDCKQWFLIEGNKLTEPVHKFLNNLLPDIINVYLFRSQLCVIRTLTEENAMADSAF